MSTTISLARFRADRDIAFIQRRLAELEEQAEDARLLPRVTVGDLFPSRSRLRSVDTIGGGAR